MIIRIAVLSSAALLAACVRGPLPGRRPEPLEPRVAGCYELVPGPWLTDSLLSSVFPVRQAPTRFQLTVARFTGWPLQSDSLPMYQVKAYPAAGQTGGMFAMWQRLKTTGDVIRVSYPAPFAGVALQLKPEGAGLAGRVVTFTDALRPHHPAQVDRPITARRIECPSDGRPPGQS